MEHCLNLHEAETICGNYQHLADKVFIEGSRVLGKIEQVAIAPADSFNKWLFMDIYKQLHCLKDAMRFYKKQEYDVVVIISLYSGETIAKDLKTYLETNGSHHKDVLTSTQRAQVVSSAITR